MELKDVYTADFETTTKINLEKDGYVRVYLWSLVNCESMQEYYGFNIRSFLEKIKELNARRVFFHNLKFDGQFILYHLVSTHYRYGKDYNIIIDGLNSWYEIELISSKFKCKIWDSSKKFPGLSVKEIAKMYKFSDKHECPDFSRYLPYDYIPPQKEIEYCLQDSRIIAFAIQKEWNNGHKLITLSSDAFTEVKDKCLNGKYWRDYFPLISGLTDTTIRLTYKGGYVYLKPELAGLDLENVTTFDVNSLYPHVMRNTRLPFGYPEVRLHKGNELYTKQFACEFKLKEGYLPTLQIKNSYKYSETEYLTKSEGSTLLNMTSIDYDIFKKHYDVWDETEPVELVFKDKIGLLRPYIDYWYDVKNSCKVNGIVIDPALYYISKRYLNSPYGKTGMRPDRINKIPSWDGINVKFERTEESTDSIYIPYATFVCAQARKITIEGAQNNYDDFIYSDTDSIHLLTDKPKGIKISDTELGYFKQENRKPYDYGKYLKAKTYAHAMIEDNEIKIKEIHTAGYSTKKAQNITWEQFNYGYESNDNSKIYTVPGGCIICASKFSIKK